jgi:hypothetical protein
MNDPCIGHHRGPFRPATIATRDGYRPPYCVACGWQPGTTPPITEAEAAERSRPPTRRRLLLVPMHETTTATDCAECPMLAEGYPTRGLYCAGFDADMPDGTWDPTLGRTRHARLAACITAEEAAQE